MSKKSKKRKSQHQKIGLTRSVKTVDNAVESEKIEEIIYETPPARSLDQRGIAIVLVVVSIVLVLILVFFMGKTNKATSDLQKSSQDQLLNIKQSTTDSLGQTTGASSQQPADSNLQQTSPVQ